MSVLSDIHYNIIKILVKRYTEVKKYGILCKVIE